jgi:peptidoglycan/LPS O-acetylase OafA/YrhL
MTTEALMGEDRTTAPQTQSRPAPLAAGKAAHPEGWGHLPALDGVRGLAILLVLFYHFTVFNPRTPVDDYFTAFTGLGWCGVDLFFVLSGFLITGILFDSKGRQGYFSTFYARRVLRIFPLYYGIVILSLVILPRFPHPKAHNFGRIAGDELWYWLYLSNYSIARAGHYRHAILDISWSLAIEEQFYLLWPLIVALFSRRALLRICGCLIVTALLLRCWLIYRGVNPLTVYVIAPTRMDSLAVGAWLALFLREEEGRRLLAPIAKGVLLLGLPLLGVCVALQRTDAFDPIMQTAGYSLLALLSAAVVTISVAQPAPAAWNRVFCHPFMTAFGKYSYALYLFHLPLRALVRDTFYGPARFPALFGSKIPGQLIFYLLSGALSFLAAWLSWNLLEKHVLKLKRFFRYGARLVR